jgi:hypothetical protein
VPSLSDVQEDVDVVGWQVWQASPALTAPVAIYTAPIQHPLPQAPVRQIAPEPQPVPSATLVQEEVEVDARQLWQELIGFAVESA